MEKSYRIKTNIGSDSVLNVKLKQDIDIYEILSLTLKQDNIYKVHSADYGVIVGRVLGNDAFGIPNARVSVFIPLTDEDSTRSDIKNIYPYKSVNDLNKNGLKYNTLPSYKKFDCHQEVGSFPKKQLVLDNDSILEVFDKYYKYTTVTNNAGDYMIFGVPTGEQILHVDLDLSDIGILSQEPRDFIYKGYSRDLFESPTQFKKSTNLDDLVQIYNESTSVTVYPFWGDDTTNEIAITRKDVNIQYKFEPTCVFIGSVVTDTGDNSISHNCIPDEKVGEAGQLSPNKGNIEMIRKTINDTVEEYQVRGNELIDGDGTWCYQIPMNLDYIGTDELGNIVPTNNPEKGIPTRTRVRFRITLDESGDNGISSHRARYLIPNNPDLYEDVNVIPAVSKEIINGDSYYEFGSLTPDDCFRDLYWNKVYSVKNYIPRLQMSKYEKTSQYLAIKGVNKKNASKNNPFPFNKLNLNIKLGISFMLYKYWKYDVRDHSSSSDNIFRNFWRLFKSYSVPYNIDAIRDSILEDNDGISLDFYNDWINGCLYFPLWYWRVREKTQYKKGEPVYDSSFCECNGEKFENDQMHLYNNCSLVYNNEELGLNTNNEVYKNFSIYQNGNEMYYTSVNFGSKSFFSGIIKKKTNKDNAELYYYSFGNKIDNTNAEGDDNAYRYVRLFSTDIILLGSLKDADIDNVPKIPYNLPSTTSNIPPMGRYKKVEEEEGEVDAESNLVSHNGMNWGTYWLNKSSGVGGAVQAFTSTNPYKYKLGSGLFFGINVDNLLLGIFSGVTYLSSDFKTCVNAERICELGVTFDEDVEINKTINDKKIKYRSEADGLITSREIDNYDLRALFATLNSNKLIGLVENKITGYKGYLLDPFYPTNFDGRLETIAPSYTSGVTRDDRNKDYLDFRFGSSTSRVISTERYLFDEYVPPTRSYIIESSISKYKVDDGAISYVKVLPERKRRFYAFNSSNEYDKVYPYPSGNYVYTFPLYNNSFYFYFGLNQGSTAIDKFYEQFYSDCETEKAESIDIFTHWSREPEPCHPTDGELFVVMPKNFVRPCTFILEFNDIEKYKETISDTQITFNGLTAGSYIVRIIDKIGNEAVKYVSFRYPKVELSFSKTNMEELTILANICDNENCGKITFLSYILEGTKSTIETLTRPESLDNWDGSFIIDEKVKIIVEPINGGKMKDYVCNDVVSGNYIKIKRAGTFSISIYELCNMGELIESRNYSTYTVTISSRKIKPVNY